MLPLDGLTVLDFSRLLPGPLATLFLADLGARVIKVEDPNGGDYIRWTPPLQGEYSSYFYLLNRGKESIAVDLKTDEGKNLIKRVIKKTDVVVESFRPGVMDSLGLGYKEFSKINPSLIYCPVTGYGDTKTKYRKKAGHDMNYISLNGIASVNGTKETGPLPVGVQVADIAGGSYMAVIGILAALIERGISGKGKFIDVSMFHGSIPLVVMAFANQLGMKDDITTENYALNGLYPSYRIYKTRNGFVSLAALEPKFWNNFCKAINRDDLLDAGYETGVKRGEVISVLEKIFISKTSEEWEKLNEKYDFCCEPVNNLSTVLNNELISENTVLGKDTAGKGFIRFPIANLRRENLSEPEKLGESTEKILEEFKE